MLQTQTMYVAVPPARTRALLANGCTETQSWAACGVFVGLGLGDGLLVPVGLGEGVLVLLGLAVGVGVVVLRGLVVGLAVGVGVVLVLGLVLGLELGWLGSGDGELKVDCAVGLALTLRDVTVAVAASGVVR